MAEVFEVEATVKIGLGLTASDRSEAERVAKEKITVALSKAALPAGFNVHVIGVKAHPKRETC